MDESRFGKFSALKTTFPLNMSAMKRPKQKKNFVLQKPSEIQENKEKRTHTLNIVDEQAPSASRKKKRMSLVSKLSLGRFRGSTITNERHGPEGGNNSRSRSQSSSQESPVWFEKGEVVEQVEKGGILQRPRSTVTVVHRKSPSLTIGHAPQQKQLLPCSHSILSDPQLNTQVDLAQKSLLLEERRALFQHRESHPISSPDSGSDSNLDNSTRSVSVGCSEDNQDRKVNRTARHISVRKFDTFSTFEGTFDEDTGLGYLVGIEENRIESCEDTGMPATNDSQDSTVTI